MAINEKRNGWVGQNGIPAIRQSSWPIKIIWLSMKRGMVGMVRMEYLLPGNLHYSSTWTQRLTTTKETIWGLVDKKDFHQCIERNLPGYSICRKSIHG
jgi:hypothetical protein